jgi:hypothetical protein
VAGWPKTHGTTNHIGPEDAMSAAGTPAGGPTAAQRRRQAELAQALARTGFVLPGTLLERYGRCGKTNCRCHNDPPTLHGPYYQWTRKVDGRTVTRVLSREQAQRYQSWFTDGQKARQTLAELETLSLDVLEQAEGWAGTDKIKKPQKG